ncbi:MULTISPECIES: response regulator [unclassified Hahella]|uniref:response regulator n=1 Tax=unclassified Hahella TaxID=2624107 RepID=UPI000FDD0541|nr:MULTISPECIES: response regulator [unclassified Hahella]AZZ92203.1 response regulator [Hahella sp. KA22]MBU6951198.1 response regulator [Hahella sp. HN01]MDG9670463.1 response regulator [Hahella sp. CR1]QAY55574.1 response regulator [Hahella sp. KA22]WLQ16036.1 response regulator [Hahella sp. HNIBRBA332]
MAKTILIIDDSISLRQMVDITLKSAGYNVIQAENGQDALGKLPDAKPSLIVCDVNMPVMDGISFVKELKSLPEYKFTPVIMLTTESTEDKRMEGQMAGAKAWMVKPFRPEAMLKAVQKLILP